MQARRTRGQILAARAGTLDATIASIDPAVLPDPAAGSNVEQHRALRDD